MGTRKPIGDQWSVGVFAAYRHDEDAEEMVDVLATDRSNVSSDGEARRAIDQLKLPSTKQSTQALAGLTPCPGHATNCSQQA